MQVDLLHLKLGHGHGKLAEAPLCLFAGPAISPVELQSALVSRAYPGRLRAPCHMQVTCIESTLHTRGTNRW